MKEYEIVCTYLNGCAGDAYPLTSFEEVEISDTDSYIRNKHSKDYWAFVKEVQPDGRIVYTFDNGTIRYIYEFNEL